MEVERQALQMTRILLSLHVFLGHVEAGHETMLVFEVCQDAIDVCKQAALWGRPQWLPWWGGSPTSTQRASITKGRDAQEHVAGHCEHLQALRFRVGEDWCRAPVPLGQHTRSARPRKDHQVRSPCIHGLVGGCVPYEPLKGKVLFSGKRNVIFSAVLQGFVLALVWPGISGRLMAVALLEVLN